MRFGLSVVAICVASMLGVGAFVLYQKGLLSEELLRLYQSVRQEEEASTSAPAPIGLAASLQEKERRLERQFQEAQELDGRLKVQKQELELEKAKIYKQLQMLQQRADAGLETGIKAQAMADLVKIYEGMEPEGTASIMEELSSDIGAEILLQMRRRQASRVMESLSTPKAVAISAEILPEKIAKIN